MTRFEDSRETVLVLLAEMEDEAAKAGDVFLQAYIRGLIQVAEKIRSPKSL